MQYFGGEMPSLAEICHKQFIAVFRKSLFDNKVLLFPPFPKYKNIPFSHADLQTEVKPGGGVGVAGMFSFGKGGATPRAGLLSG